MTNTFTIQKGNPIAPEDNRSEVEELHVHVLFRDKNIHAQLWEYLDNYPGIFGRVESYQYDISSELCTLDIVFNREDGDYRRIIDIVSNGVHLFLLNNKVEASVKSVYPEQC